MRASPAFQVTLERFGVWRGAVSAIAALSAACVVAWAATRPGGVSAASLAVAVAVSISIVACGASLARVPPVQLRFDGELWHLGPPDVADASDEPHRSGTLSVALDLGGWMLLRFAPQPLPPAKATRTTWLPVQRRGLAAPWHALRCAVYAPRAPDAAAVPAEWPGRE